MPLLLRRAVAMHAATIGVLRLSHVCRRLPHLRPSAALACPVARLHGRRVHPHCQSPIRSSSAAAPRPPSHRRPSAARPPPPIDRPATNPAEKSSTSREGIKGREEAVK
uniref:Uncharacterized protein n=1 Tax=Oryza sativa subsp. japonica TaxID=39947 RepID=Q6ZLE1_ORYSJ|nr:hypothetical protein [Oryza sativa Japonica Group]